VKKTSFIKYGLISSLLISSGFMLQAFDEGNSHAWGSIEYDEDPWVFNASRPYFVTAGLQNRHLSLWASHGRYWDAERGWKWQRPNLFCTTEDLFTQTIVVPYLIPMLENAGAIVFTPRERDWQQQEIVVDNDDRHSISYQEIVNGKKWKNCDSLGFANLQASYQDGENPFQMGTVRQAKATKRKKNSLVSYQPNFQKEGKYAVYVSYQTLPKSVPDAKYIVYHKGQATEFTVNQRMGGGTWVYLGTFEFDKGCNEFNRVVCTNHASRRGVVTTDAVRFGGGMGNIERGGFVSGLPRCLEGARYYAQWAGAPYSVYGGRKGKNDYADDINTRSMMTNWLGGGSVYMPAMDGKHVPIELSLALHSDAGYNPDGQSTWGALAICTTDFNDGMLNSGISRFASKDFAKALRDNLVEDMTNTFGSFGKRYLWDRNYSETRLPEVPSAIIEMLSHQSFPDMRIAQDPMGKFTIARSIYKTILRFVSSNHDEPYVVQPLAPNHFSVEVDELGYASLTWNAQLDKTEPTAKPTSYIVYQAEGKGGFDNGTMVRSNIYNVKLEPGKLYNFRVAAVNQGGESFPSETLSALYNPTATNKILIVNNFHRLASPQVVDNDSIQGFDFDQDPGVSYGLTAGWSGKQRVFDIHRMGIESSSGLGYSGNEMIGQFVAGNDFNHTVEHAQAIASGNKYSIASCSSEAILSGRVKMTDYQAVDLINGLERYDGYTHQYYKTFTPAMQKRIKYYALNGGKLLVSGSYNGSDMQDEEEKSFMGAILKVNYEPTGTKFIVQDVNPEDSTITERDSIVTTSPMVSGLGKEFSYYHSLNAKHYAATHPEILKPIGSTAFCAMRYLTGTSAAVAYRSTSYRTFTMGFPLECISDEKTRYSIMQGILKFLTE
jgi:gamma-glutamylcyclotransferase (GGCT)/AIG2-like uncharacterized protein YtfP